MACKAKQCGLLSAHVYALDLFGLCGDVLCSCTLAGACLAAHRQGCAALLFVTRLASRTVAGWWCSDKGELVELGDELWGAVRPFGGLQSFPEFEKVTVSHET